MAFQQPAAVPRLIPRINDIPQETATPLLTPQLEESQEWILFAPSTKGSNVAQTATDNTAELSRLSDLGSLNTAARSGVPETPSAEGPVEDDADLDSLDEGLHAFREPVLYPTISREAQRPVLPAHDGLGMFPASSGPVLEQIWQHEQFNPKRKHSGLHRRMSNIQEKLDHLDELEAQANEEKRIRIEKWRLEQGQAMMEEVEKHTRRQERRDIHRSIHMNKSTPQDDLLSSTPKQSDFLQPDMKNLTIDVEPIWRRITRRFIQDIIGIDEPLLSVILGESLPDEAVEDATLNPTLTTIPEELDLLDEGNDNWRNRLLQRIARELGVFVHQISPHPGAFSFITAEPQPADYAGIPIHSKPQTFESIEKKTSNMLHILPTLGDTNQFGPTIHDQRHAQSWGFEEEPPASSSTTLESSLDLQREREYWERELDVKMVFRYLRDRFSARQPSGGSPPALTAASQTLEANARRAAIIRQHHPLMARAQRSPVRMRRESRSTVRRPLSSCASESVKSSRRVSLARSGSSRNYWDIGGSLGSGSLLASGGLMGAWGEV